jgi:energy-converting hydrogenase B subunit D
VIPLQVVSLALVALVGTIVVLVRDPLRQIVLISLYGLALVVLFVIFQAPDVALSMLVVGAIGYPLVVLVAISRVRGEPHDSREGREK